MTDKAKVLWVHLGTWALVSSDLDILHDTMYSGQGHDRLQSKRFKRINTHASNPDF